MKIAPSSHNSIFLPQGLCTGCLLTQWRQSLHSPPVNSPHPSAVNLQRLSLTCTPTPKPCHLNWVLVTLLHVPCLIPCHHFLSRYASQLSDYRFVYGLSSRLVVPVPAWPTPNLSLGSEWRSANVCGASEDIPRTVPGMLEPQSRH